MAAPSAPVASRWFAPEEVDPQATLRLFLFPHAGSGVTIYKEWDALLPPSVAHQCVQLPGRQHRLAEPAYTDMAALLDALYEVILAELDDRPYAFFGHCMGAQLAYRLTAMIEHGGGPGPVLVGASGWAPEGFLTPTMEHSRLPEADLKQWIVDLGSLPAEVYENPELLAMVIPTLRADLAVCATAVDDGARISCPVVSYSGRADPLMVSDAMPSWADRTTRYLGNSEFPGGHFYIDEHAQAVTADLTRHLRRLVAPGAR
ncbi:MAG TPA: alpha/beta fold hydrolase [Pilimelia sp.]|nr:alpha/beta fold hydrolase [Pilimelia sp.]